jgi:hypothetical protein
LIHLSQLFLEMERNVFDYPSVYPKEIKVWLTCWSARAGQSSHRAASLVGVNEQCIRDPQFGVADFFYDEKDLTVFTACEDVHTLSRLDSQISNFRLPWEKPGAAIFLSASPAHCVLLASTGCVVPIGSFNCWRLNGEGQWKATFSYL